MSALVAEAFEADIDDDEACASVKKFICTREPADLTEGEVFVQTNEGRSALARALESGRSSPEVDATTFDNLVALLVAALASLLAQNDSANAPTFMNMVSHYYKVTDGSNFAVSDEHKIKDSPLWKDLKFWQNAIFEGISAERAKKYGDEASWAAASAEDRELRMQQEQNVAFGQVSCIAMQMIDFGGVDAGEVANFLKKLHTLQVLNLSGEHGKLLGQMISGATGKEISVIDEISVVDKNMDTGGMVSSSADPFADVDGSEAAQRAYRAAEMKAVKWAEEEFAKLLLPGAAEDGSKDERIVSNAGRCVARLMDGSVHGGVLFLTTYRVAFISKEIQGVAIEVPILGILSPPDGLMLEGFFPLSTEFAIEVATLKVTAKDVRQLYFFFDEDMVNMMQAAESDWAGETTKSAEEFASRLRERGVPRDTKRKAKKDDRVLTPMESKVTKFMSEVNMEIISASPGGQFDPETTYTAFRHRSTAIDKEGLSIYDAHKEYERQGATKEESGWREFEINKTYEFIETYPSVLVFPRNATDDLLAEVATFRNRRRLPALSWLHPENGAALVRCAQPKVGVTGKKSEADEQLFLHFAKAVPRNAKGEKVKKDMGITMLDARPWVNAMANKGKGGGVENVDNYKDSDTTLVYLDIDNIHVMRKSLNFLFGLIRSTERTGVVSRRELMEADLPWPTYVGRCMGGGATIVRQMHEVGRTIVVHCSDGWDRTAQLAAFPVVCMDPFYRTMDGFRVVCQREWNSFGHKLRDRLWGHKAHERSPIFLQFLDCVQNLLHAYPTAFEFNEWFLIRLSDAIVSMAYSDFRFNREMDFSAEVKNQSPAMVWSVLYDEATREEFLNKNYDPSGERVIMPPQEARTWLAYFNRWTEDPVFGVAQGMAGVSAGQIPSPPSRPVRSLEELVLNGTKHPPAPRFVELPYRYKGELWQTTGKLKKERQQMCILHEFVDGEATLVYYEEQKSLSTVPIGTIPLHEGGFSVHSMPRRAASVETGRSYFQLRWQAKGTGAEKIAARMKLEELMPVLEQVAKFGSNPVASKKLSDVAANSTAELGDCVATWLLRRLSNSGTDGKLKTLSLIETLIKNGNGSFNAALKTKCLGEITLAKAYEGDVYAEDGADQSGAEVVRSSATKLCSELDVEFVAEKPAGASEERTIFSTDAENLQGWLDAITQASGQASVVDASDDEEAGLTEQFAQNVELVSQGLVTAKDTISSVANEAVALTKRFSGKATAAMLDHDHGMDDSKVVYQLEDFEITVKAKKSDVVRWNVESGWRVRWKLVAGSHNIGFHAYFVADPNAPPTQTPREIEDIFSVLEPLLLPSTSEDEKLAPDATLVTLKETVASATKEVGEKIAQWLETRLQTENVTAKIKTLRIVDALFEAGNPEYKVSTKTYCLATVAASKSFACPPDPKVRRDFYTDL